MIEIHTLRWRGDHAVGAVKDEDPGEHLANDLSIYCRVFVDGVELENVSRARTLHRNDFTMTVITLHQEAVIVNHDAQSWADLGKAEA